MDDILKSKTGWSLFTGLLILGLTLGYLTLFKPVPIPLKQPLNAFPLIIGGWVGQETKPENSFLKEVKTLDHLDRVYRKENGGEMNLSIRYFPLQGQEQKIVSYRTDNLHDEAKTIPINTVKGQVLVNTFSTKEDVARTTIYFWYDINGKMMTNRYKAKLESFLGVALKRKTNGALVVISNSRPSLSGSSENDFLNKSIPIIHDYLRTD